MSLFSVKEMSLKSVVGHAAKLIREGGVIAVPTDTVYGLAAAAQNVQAIKRLYEIKGRDPNKPLAICIDSVKSIALWGKVECLPIGLLDMLLPGPVTVILERTSLLNPLLNPDTPKIGIRIPDSIFIRDLCNKIKTPLALTSANIANEPSTLSPEEFESLWPKLDGIFHNGRIGETALHRAGSTVVDLSTPGKYHIVRDGSALDNTLLILEQFELTLDSTSLANGVCRSLACNVNKQ